jgi:hypothetical protein
MGIVYNEVSDKIEYIDVKFEEVEAGKVESGITITCRHDILVYDMNFNNITNTIKEYDVLQFGDVLFVKSNIEGSDVFIPPLLDVHKCNIREVQLKAIITEGQTPGRVFCFEIPAGIFVAGYVRSIKC